jgi:hypothetical protein
MFLEIIIKTDFNTIDANSGVLNSSVIILSISKFTIKKKKRVAVHSNLGYKIHTQ